MGKSPFVVKKTRWGVWRGKGRAGKKKDRQDHVGEDQVRAAGIRRGWAAGRVAHARASPFPLVDAQGVACISFFYRLPWIASQQTTARPLF